MEYIYFVKCRLGSTFPALHEVGIQSQCHLSVMPKGRLEWRKVFASRVTCHGVNTPSKVSIASHRPKGYLNYQ